MINIHPRCCPPFPGSTPIAARWRPASRFAGCTVHFVRFETDTGPIIAQAAVPVLPGDDEESLAARVLAAEHRLYPLALRPGGRGAGARRGRTRDRRRPGRPRGCSLINPARLTPRHGMG